MNNLNNSLLVERKYEHNEIINTIKFYFSTWISESDIKKCDHECKANILFQVSTMNAV